MNKAEHPWFGRLLAGCLIAIVVLSCAAIGLTLAFMLRGEAEVAATTAPPATVPVLAQATPAPAPETTLSPTSQPTRLLPLPTATAPPPTPSPELPVPDSVRQQPPGSLEQESLAALLAADYPAHDLFTVAQRLGRSTPRSRTVPATPYQAGDLRTFFAGNGTVEARLAAVTEHTYFWVETGLEVDDETLRMAAETFEREYYPRLVHLFGQEWRPGVDNDPHFSVLHLAGDEASDAELGYFYSGDEYPRALSSGSNEQELVYLHANALAPGSDLYYGTLVHEFQHLVQWYLDGNESVWLDEGLSQLAELYVGLDTAETLDYLQAPETPLHRWGSGESIYAHYAATYLFCVYFWEQLGEEAVQELARHPANGLAAVASVLAGSGADRSLTEFLGDWSVANYVDDPAAGPAFSYERLETGRAAHTAGIKFTPNEQAASIPQMGVHYIDIRLDGPATLTFAGDTLAPLLPVPPHTGETVWYAPAQENVSAHLTRELDLSGLDEATLNFWAWYDLRYDTDAAYVTVSADGGATWRALPLRNGRAAEYGSGLSGRSIDRPGAAKGGWVEETISLDDYAGQRILVRFDLLTFGSTEVAGLALDDIRILEQPAGSGEDDEEAGWQAAGFVRTGQWLPQQWSVHYIRAGERPEVVELSLNEMNQGIWTVNLGPEGGTLAIAALTPYVLEDANYWLAVTR